ncbi:MAG: aminoacyl-tRNA hydrolase [Candidatus Acidiferrales bacterium]
MKLIVGLGNPGAEYESTPHNLGFLAADTLAGRNGIRLTRPEAKSFLGRGEIAGHEVVIAKPQTMMNLSGVAVRDMLQRFECTPADLILLSDEVALPWGMIRINERGSAGGHNGLKSIVQAAGMEFIRVRMGVKPEHPIGDLADYVLCPMNREHREIAQQMATDAAEAVEIILGEGAAKAMAKFNRRVEPEAGADIDA